MQTTGPNNCAPTMRENRWPVWSGSVKEEVKFRPVPKEDMREWMAALLQREIETRKPKHQEGDVSRNGLAVARAMYDVFLNWKTGQLTPSWKQIASAAGISEHSVYRGLKRLKAIGALDWVRRCVPDFVNGIFCLKQISNAYFIKAKSFVRSFRRKPECPEPSPEEVGLAAAPLDPPPPDAAEMVARARSPAEYIAAREIERKENLSGWAPGGRNSFDWSASDPVRLSEDTLRAMAARDARKR